MNSRKITALAAAAMAALAMSTAAHAQDAADWPKAGQTMQLIVPYAAGGGVDLGARLLADGLQKQLGITVVVINKPGGGSQVGLTQVVQSAPDGYTLGYVVLPTVVTHYLDASRQAPYTRADFTKIGVQFASQYVISVLADSPFKTLDDLIKAAKDNPGGVTIGDAGVMTAPHLMTAELGQAAKVQFSSIHYAGGAPALTALRGGEVQALATGGTDTLPYLQDNEVRVLGVSTAEESTILPGQPTMKEQGYDVIGDSLTGVVAPPGLPAAIQDKIVAAMKAVVESPEQTKMLTERGVIPDFQGPADFDKLWQDNETRLKDVLPTLAQQ
ncbi:MAG TPA: tripartite tricarboxylate transporter substrate binding protein [Devosiaceae bacterium]|jgi:tripartite-type tricarboxylate transporter receptor subunit TctC